jgi:acetolactate synthase-1/2/3 large subunit
MPLRVADYIFDTIARLGVRDVFSICGGGIMHLSDGLVCNKNLNYIATLHEQAAAMAAEAYARMNGTLGVALLTTGPGSTNAITGIVGAWIDSIPTLYLTGQVPTHNMIKGTGLRQFGVQEVDIVKIVKSITKYSVTIEDSLTVRYHLEKAIHLATTGRTGPVLLDIPLNVQGYPIDSQKQKKYRPPKDAGSRSRGGPSSAMDECVRLLMAAKRPIVISGYGIRLAKAMMEYQKLVEILGAPIISSWNTSDLLPFNHPLYVGRSGIMGDRAGNFAVQNADLLLILGSRMSVPQVGYDFPSFARAAKRIMVDIDPRELSKASMRVDLPICSDVGVFIRGLLDRIKGHYKGSFDDWNGRCQSWKRKYPVVLPEYKDTKGPLNSYYFIDVLSDRLRKDAIVVTDMGTSFTCTMQAFKTKAGQRLFTSTGCASMGFGLPGAIGACLGAGRKKTVCISGDGGLQMNIQELQTLVQYKLPIILFVLNNKGYLTIKLMQKGYFGRYAGSEESSGLSLPDVIRVATAYGIQNTRISCAEELNKKIDSVLKEPGPFVCEILMPEDQALIPRVSSFRRDDGSMVTKPLEDLYPFLDREEFLSNMIIPPVPE